MTSNQSLLHGIREELQTARDPVVIYNKSHSGSRLLGALVAQAGVFMGAHQNESNDSLDLLRLVNYLVGSYYPDFQPLWDERSNRDTILPGLVREVFTSHLEGFDVGLGGMWGWKLCETNYVVPFIDFLFPRARFIHLIRDGRDVAFCDHRGPDNPFWRKIYFNTDRITSWRGLLLTARDYRRESHVYNAVHWVNSVTVGRSYGMMLRERYLEVRYEDLCSSFEETAARVFRFIGLDDGSAVIRRLSNEVHTRSVGKYRQQSSFKRRKILEITKPLLLSLGYLQEDR